ncbi:MAG TPA: hypothetical protein VF181_00285 [Balneolaceae bacterium]
MNENVKDELNKFISIVQESFQKLLRKHKIALCAVFLAVFLVGCSLAVILESLFYLPVAAKFALILLLLIFSAGAALYSYFRLNPPSFKEFYHHFSKKNGTPELSNAFDLHFDANTRKSPLYVAAINQNIGSLKHRNIASYLNSFTGSHSISRHYRQGLVGSSIGILLLITFVTFQPAAVSRLTHIWENYSPPNPYGFTVEPGTLTLEQGQSFAPKIRFEGDVPENISLAFKTNIEDKFRRRNPVTVENGQAVFLSISPAVNGQYYFLMDGFKSDVYGITVQLRPRFEQLTIRVVPPAYTQLDTASFAYPFSKITAYPGSEILLHAVTNKQVSDLSLHRTATDSADLVLTQATSTVFNHSWTFKSADTVSFTMQDRAGLSNKNDFQFIVEATRDRPPFVNLVEPEESLEMKTPQSLNIQYKAGDDFGLTEASLHYEHRRAFVEKPEKGSISLADPVMNQLQSYIWNIPGLEPKPRDVITFWIEVKDNDAYNGAKTGRSQKLTIIFPSITEYLDELDSREANVAESLENISESFTQMQQEYDRFKQQLKQNPKTNWEQKQSLREVQQQQQKIDEQLEKLNEEFGEIRQEIEKDRMMSPETIQAYEELQQLMKEINSPELAEALEKLRESLGKMNPDQLRQALQNYEFNEKLYKERIKRTIELFKSLRLNSDLEKMAVVIEKLADREQQLAKSTAGEKELERQKVIQKDLQDVQKQLEELGENAPGAAKNKVQELQKNAGQKLGQINKDLQENIERLKKQKSEAAGEKNPQVQRQQQQIQQQMRQMAQQIRSAKKQLNQQQRQVNMSGLKYILYSLINLSQNQEELAKETESLPYRSKAFVEQARKEQNISQQFSMLADSLFQLSSELPSFSNQINKKKIEVENQLKQSVELLAERDKANSMFAMQHSLGGVNELASMVASLLNQLQNQPPGGGGGAMSTQQFIEQLQKMTGQQQKLNQQIQQMINDIQGNRLSQNQLERLEQLSEQQNLIRKQLEELQQQGVFDSGDRVLSELERMSEQMEDAINDLRGGQLNRPLMQRQQNILSRMLSAEEAIQERGKKKEREATAAENSPRSNPPDITLEELQQQLREMLNNPSRTKFKEDYQRLIEQYFKLLEQQMEQTEDDN